MQQLKILVSIVNLNFTMRQLNILVSIVNFEFHHVATQESWSRHQICDTSFSCITILILLEWVSICLNKCKWKSLLVVVSTSPVVWSQVRWFFLMRIVFHALLTMMK